jgi:hypothetical protein
VLKEFEFVIYYNKSEYDPVGKKGVNRNLVDHKLINLNARYKEGINIVNYLF